MTDVEAKSMFTCPYCRNCTEPLVKTTGHVVLPNGASSIIVSFSFGGEEVAVAVLSEAGLEETVCLLPIETHTAAHTLKKQYRIVSGRYVTEEHADVVDPLVVGWVPEIHWSPAVSAASERVQVVPEKAAATSVPSFAEMCTAWVDVTAALRAAVTDEDRQAACEAAALVQVRFGGVLARSMQ